MRLTILHAAPDTSDRAIVRGIFAGEAVLASRGITLPECLAAFVAEARKEPPTVALQVFEDAERAALAAAFGSAENAGGALLGLALGPGDTMPDIPSTDPTTTD